MMKRVEEKRLYQNDPLPSPIEWHPSRSRYFAVSVGTRGHRLIVPSSGVNFEAKVYSQHGEDGILQEIFRRVGEGHKFSVEFGVGDGTECSTPATPTGPGKVRSISELRWRHCSDGKKHTATNSFAANGRE
jgi:hypothetical protein